MHRGKATWTTPWPDASICGHVDTGFDFPQFGTTILQWSQAKQSFVAESSLEDDYSGVVGELPHRAFSGATGRKTLPINGDSTTFVHEPDNGMLKLTRVSALAGTCVFIGEYSAKTTSVDSSGAYTGSLWLTPDGGGTGFMEIHTGCDHRYELQP